MKDADFEFLSNYREIVKNQIQLIKFTAKDPNAPVDAARGMEAELKRYREEYRDRVLDLLVEHVVSQEIQRRDE